jgi:hypothetical protein
VSPTSASTTSRAYWELKAEQVMDRVFLNATDPEPRPAASAAAPDATAPIEVAVREAAGPRPWLGPNGTPSLAMACGLAALSLLACLGLWRGWSEAHNDLRQERNLRLLEGIRGLAVPAGDGGPLQASANADGLPPPPPTEPWIEELQQLEARPGALAPLQVPLSGTLRAPAPPLSSGAISSAAPLASGSGGMPELLGVVQIPGRSGSAIFQVGGSSSNALVGDSIGNSGWRLVATSGDGAVIERGGVTRRVSISAGF